MSGQQQGTGCEATIRFGRNENGYWGCEVVLCVPGLPQPYVNSGDLFHDVDECLTWARQQIQGLIA